MRNPESAGGHDSTGGASTHSLTDSMACSPAHSAIPVAQLWTSAQKTPAIPDHELLRRIGMGSYGEVWLARNALGSLRAVKVVYRKSFDHDKPYEREFEGLKQFEPISHASESQVDIFHVGRNDDAGFFYYIMELADDAEEKMRSGKGEKEKMGILSAPFPLFSTATYTPRTLKHDLRTRGALPVAECVQIALWLARALGQLHAHGLVHRDIKPSNIIFVKGVPKLADIGLVTSVDATRSFVGTDGYIPPEGPGTPQADLYSLGKLLYECVTGKDRLDFPELPADWRTRPDFDQLLEFNEIVTKACDDEPSQRYASAQGMLTDLTFLEQGQSIKRKRVSGRRWKLAQNMTLATIIAALVYGSAIFAFRGPNRKRTPSSNREALNLYNQAVYMLNRATPEGRLQAFTNLTQAVKLDSKFVDAHYMLFEVYFSNSKLPPFMHQMTNFRWVVNSLRAVAPHSAQYHTASAWIKFVEFRFDDAIAELELALRTDPRFVRAHCFFAMIVLRVRGDAETALRHFRIAEDIDSKDAIIQLQLGTPFHFRREYAKAIEQYQKAAALEPNAASHWFLELAYEGDQQYGKALDEYELDAKSAPTAKALEVEARFKRWRLALAEKGPRGMWQAMLEDQKRDWPDPYVMARLHARLGETNEALDLLEKAYQERNVCMPDLLFDDHWDAMREHPRFQDIMSRVGLKPKR